MTHLKSFLCFWIGFRLKIHQKREYIKKEIFFVVNAAANMNVESEQLRMTTIKDLPFLVLTKIFKKLPSKDRGRCMKVCKQWHDIINWEVGLTCCIGKAKFILPRHNNKKKKSMFWEPLDVIGKRGIDKCIFGEVSSADDDYDDESLFNRDDNENETSTAMTCFMLPELVKEITFIGEIRHELFSSIVAPTYWLNTLRIHLIVLNTVNFANISLKLCSLSHFKVFYTHPEHNLVSPLYDAQQPSGVRKRVHVNFRMLLANCYFPQIKIFEYLGPYFIEKTKCLVEGVRRFVNRHEKSLKELVLSFPYEWRVSGVNVVWKNSVNNSRTTTNECEICSSEVCTIGSWGNVQLTRLVIFCPATIISPPLISYDNEERRGVAALSSSWAQKELSIAWKSLLLAQKELKNLQYINTFEDWKFPGILFFNSASSLTTISLSINSNFNVDCKVLADCVNLTKLTLEGNFFHADFPTVGVLDDEVDEMGIGIGELFNAHYLPSSLEEICFSKLLIPTTETLPIVNMDEPWHLPNLRTLQLYQISKNLPQFGLTPRAVQSIFDQSALSISFWQALNVSTFQEAIDKSSSINSPDSDVSTLIKILEISQHQDDLGFMDFSDLNDCHVELIRK